MRYLILSVLLLTFSSCKISKAVSASFSKEMCSCLFVEGQSENYCRDYAKQMIEVEDYKVDWSGKSVWSRGLKLETVVRFQSKRRGCQFID
jgi:hypothetical protein